MLRDIQKRCMRWARACFAKKIVFDPTERTHRFFEEATELVQSLDMTKSEAYQLVDYVYDRPKGEPFQEVGGTLNTLLLLCEFHNIDAEEAINTEMDRVEQPEMMEKINLKQATKIRYTPLPGGLEKFEPMEFTTYAHKPFPELDTHEDVWKPGNLSITVHSEESSNSMSMTKEQVELFRDNLTSWLQTH